MMTLDYMLKIYYPLGSIVSTQTGRLYMITSRERENLHFDLLELLHLNSGTEPWKRQS